MPILESEKVLALSKLPIIPLFEPDAVSSPSVRFVYIIFPEAIIVCLTSPSTARPRFFNIIQSGTASNPCPTVPSAPVPVYETIENPASLFADTDAVIVPSEFDEPVPPAFQFQPTYVLPEVPLN